MSHDSICYATGMAIKGYVYCSGDEYCVTHLPTIVILLRKTNTAPQIASLQIIGYVDAKTNTASN